MDPNSNPSGGNFSYDKSSQDFVAFMSSFKELNGKIKTISEVVNVQVIQAIENTRAEQFKKLAEAFRIISVNSEENIKNILSRSEVDKSTSPSQKSIEQLLTNITNTRIESNVSGERGKLTTAEGVDLKNETLIKRITDKLDNGFSKVSSTLKSVRDRMKGLIPQSVKSAWSELGTILKGGLFLLGVGKLLGVPLAEAAWNVIERGMKSLYDKIIETISKKLDVAPENIGLGVKAAVGGIFASMLFGLNNVVSFLWGITKIVPTIIYRGLTGSSAASKAAEAASKAANATAGAAANVTSATGKAAGAAAETAAVATKTMGWLAKVGSFVAKLSGVANIIAAPFSGFDAYKEFKESGELAKRGEETSAKWKKITAWLDATAAATGTAAGGLLLASGGTLAPVSTALGLISGAASLAAYGTNKYADSQLSTKTAAELKEDEDKKKDNKSSATIDTVSKASKESSRLFEESVDNLGVAIDKSIASLMDWDRRGLNPLQALSETIQKNFGSQKKDQRSQMPANTQRDNVNSVRNESAATLRASRAAFASL